MFTIIQECLIIFTKLFFYCNSFPDLEICHSSLGTRLTSFTSTRQLLKEERQGSFCCDELNSSSVKVILKIYKPQNS